MSAAPRTRWGWHRLADGYAHQLVEAAGIRRGDLVLDIGAGTGALTSPLVAAGANVIAVELHRRRAELLRGQFDDAPVTVVRADAADLRLPRRPFRVVANPPFAITTALLRRLLAPGSRLVRADLVVPLHVARRWSSPRAPGAGRWQHLFDVAIGAPIPPRAFVPPGPSSVVLILQRRADRSGRR